MNGKQYQKLAMRTCNLRDDKNIMITHGLFGLASETGEVCGIFQKSFQGHEIQREHIISELGDCMWFISEICEALDVTVDDVMEHNINKLLKRYPDGFDSEHSLHRAEGDV